VSRRALSITVGVIGTLCALLMMLGMSVMGSLMADARTENITGPGVDVFLRTPFPLEGDTVVIDVSARGGSRAGVERIQVKSSAAPEQMLAYIAGKGATWGMVVRSGKTRGESTETVRFPVPDVVAAGETMPLTLYVDYVVAMSTGDGRTFENDSRSDVLHLDVPVYTSSGRFWARVALAGKAFALFLAWFLLVWGVAALYGRSDGKPGGDAELEGIGLLMGFMGGGFLGYWFFARPVMAGYATQSTAAAVALTAAWLLLPLLWVWKRARRRKAASATPGLPRARIVSR
jgi:hypothetical protein